MLERAYRQRLEADLARWQTDGVITASTGAAIRNTLPPVAAGPHVAVAIGILGGLLIAAAFLAFVASNWVAIARPLRFAVLIAAIAGAYGIGAAFARAGRPVLADLGATVGSIIFGAAIALIGQMYHLGDDFAGGLLLWAVGALAGAALTGSRGALAVALAAGCIWSRANVPDSAGIPDVQFVPFWLLGAGLAVLWNSRAAAHLVAVAALPWWIMAAVAFDRYSFGPPLILADGAALLLGAGLALTAAPGYAPWERLRGFGGVLQTYGAFMLAIIAAVTVVVGSENRLFSGVNPPLWAMASGLVGTILAFVAAAIGRRPGPAFASFAAALALAAVFLPLQAMANGPWLGYALQLGAMVGLVISGLFDGDRPRTVAGWLGLGAVIAAITWAVPGSLLRRSVFLAAAGAVAVAIAVLLGRLRPRTRASAP